MPISLYLSQLVLACFEYHVCVRRYLKAEKTRILRLLEVRSMYSYHLLHTINEEMSARVKVSWKM